MNKKSNKTKKKFIKDKKRDALKICKFPEGSYIFLYSRFIGWFYSLNETFEDIFLQNKTTKLKFSPYSFSLYFICPFKIQNSSFYSGF